MRLPIDTNKITVLVIGTAQPALDYGTNTPRSTPEGRPLLKRPGLLLGTGDRVDPTATLTVVGPIPDVSSGTNVKCTNLTATTWTVRDNNTGRERSGVTLKADGLEIEGKTSR